MKALTMTVLLLAAVPAAASAQRRVRELPAPTDMIVSGDTSRIGLAVTGVDHNARYINFQLRASSRVEVYALDRTGRMHQMLACFLDSGATTVQPTLTEIVDNSAAYQAGSSFGNSSASRPPPRQTSVWRYAASQEQLLIMVMQEEPMAIRGCDRSGTGTLAAFGTMRPEQALDYLPRSLLRFPDTKWAAFLVQP